MVWGELDFRVQAVAREYNDERGTALNHQQSEYERAYFSSDSEFGLPDRKIADQRDLQGKRILSVGGGAANDLWYLTKDNWVVDLDFASSGLKVAAFHGVRPLRADLVRTPAFPFMDGTFDLVICKDILEHLLGPLEVLKEVRRVLRNDGFAVINVPNHFYFPMRLRTLAGKGILFRSVRVHHAHRYNEWDYMHVRFFTFKGFRELLQAAMLRPEKWFWDFGTLAHYDNPDMWFEPQEWKKQTGLPLSRRAAWALRVLKPSWRIFNAVMPRWLRSAVVSISPGLFCASFYVRVRKS